MKSIIGDKLLYDWSKLLDLQPDGLKVPINIDALKKSLLKNNFAFPFFGYKDEEGVWIIDGHTRKQVLYELLQDGEDVPELLEVQLINCESKDKAREILLEVFNQKQNPINLEVAEVYIEQNNLDIEIETINFFIEKIDVEDEGINYSDENKKANKYDNYIYLNVKMESEKEAEKLFNELQNKGYECKIIS